LNRCIGIDHRQGLAEAAHLHIVEFAGGVECVVVGGFKGAVFVAVLIHHDTGGFIDIAIGLGHMPDGKVLVLENLGDLLGQIRSPQRL
jgi:hypothetical protein